MYDPELPIFLVPFDDKYQQIASILKDKHQVELFPDLALVEDFTNKIAEIFDRDFLALPNKMRKFVQWFGPLDKFIYIDTDIVVFTKLSEILNYLDEYEFLNCDYHFKNRKLKDIFSEEIVKQNIFSPSQLDDVFNSGFWGSRKGLFTLSELYEILTECSQHKEYFDFSQKVTDQPMLNYTILKKTTKRINLVKFNPGEPGSWGGSPHFTDKNHILYDGDKPLKYIHWAGVAMKSGGPYRDLWEHYRYLGEEKPSNLSLENKFNHLWEEIKNKARKILKR